MLPIERDCHEVEHFEPGTSPALSLYLDLDPSEGGGRNLRAQVEDALRPSRIALADDDEGSAELESAVADALTHVSALSQLPRAVGVFVCPAQAFQRVIPLPDPVGAVAHWGNELLVGPLVSAVDEHERTVVALVDKERSRVFRVFLGQIEEISHTVERKPRAIQGGRAQIKSIRGVHGHGVHMGYGERNLQRRHEWHVRQHLERTLAAMRPDGHRVFLGGGLETVPELFRLLPKRMRNRAQMIGGISVDAPTPDVLARVLEVQAKAERRDEEELVSGLAERDHARSVFGPAAVSEAVADGRVHTLVYAAGTSLEGSECAGCASIAPGPAEGACPKCGDSLNPLPDLVEHLISRVIHEGGRVEEVRGNAREKLLGMRGLAALLRFVPSPYETPASRARPARGRRPLAEKR